MQTLGDIFKTFDPVEDKYISREYQSFGVYLAEKLQDERRKGLYIKMSRDLPRPVLEVALRFVIDAKARNKAALFMWKLKELGVFQKYSLKSTPKPTERDKAVKKQSLRKRTSRTTHSE